MSGRWMVCVCTSCGSGITHPPALERELPSFYPDDYSPFAVRPPLVTAAMAAIQRVRNRRFPLCSLCLAPAAGSRRRRLLDVGCGRGDLAASWIADGWEAMGIEPSHEAAALAGSQGVIVHEGTLSTVKLEPDSVHAAVFSHALEHVTDPHRDLGIVFDALRTGGRLAVIVPNWGSWQRRVFGKRWFPLEVPRHRTHFTAHGLRAALANAGFVDIVVRPGTPLITTTWSLQLAAFGRVLTRSGGSLLAGYGASVPVATLTRLIDLVLRDGDFLHAAARRPPD